MSVGFPNVIAMSQRSTAVGAQLSLDMELERDVSLADTTFVVVDLETTGGRAKATAPGGLCDAITEIGAVKVRGGEVLGELATLVDPGRAIPPQIVELTGITTAMVRDAPRIDAVLPMFLEFARARCSWRTTRDSTSASCARQPNARSSPGRARPCCAP